MTYIEHGSKNRSGELSDLRVENKEVTCHSVPEDLPKCLVYLLRLYMSKLPKYAIEQDVLYLRPKASVPADPDSPWYDEASVGKNSLSVMVKEMCAEAGKTNHSLRATGACFKLTCRRKSSKKQLAIDQLKPCALMCECLMSNKKLYQRF